MSGIPARIAALVIAVLPGFGPAAGAAAAGHVAPAGCQGEGEAARYSPKPTSAPSTQPPRSTTGEDAKLSGVEEALLRDARDATDLFEEIRQRNPFTSSRDDLSDRLSDSVEFASARGERSAPAAIRAGSAKADATWNARDAERLSQLLAAATQELLDAVAPGDRTVWNRHLHADFTHLDENGVMRTKAEFLEQLEPLSVGLIGEMEIDVFHVQVVKDVAVAVYEIQESLSYHGQHLRSRFRSMDSWLRASEGWKLISQHTSAVLKDPPATALSKAQLCEYSGTYALTADIQTRIRCLGDGLTSERDGRAAEMYRPEVRDVFFVPGKPRVRRIFLRDAQGRVSGFADRREGEDVTWRRIEGSTVPNGGRN